VAHATSSITIERPVGYVFAFILDGTNNPFWRPSVIEVQRDAATPLGPGARFIQAMRGPRGNRYPGDYRITACEPDTLIVYQVTANQVGTTGTFRFEALGEATRVTFTLDYTPKGMAGLLNRGFAGALRDEVANLTNLKRFLEQDPA
jgi:uncharacterized protein YndB with AHSA1/START domain